MKGFQVRVELYGADYPMDYEPLHEAMESANFSRAVQVNNSIRKLPTAEYMLWDETLTADEVLALTKSTVAPFWGDFSALVGECTDLRSYNLKLAGQPPH